jgi:hypothetical protein
MESNLKAGVEETALSMLSPVVGTTVGESFPFRGVESVFRIGLGFDTENSSYQK